ncbi:MAG: TlpA family protein disulfide reductase [Lutibacter sp.]
MKFKITKKFISNLVFYLIIGMLIYSPTRIWFLRQLAFSPSIEKVENQQSIQSYNWDLKGLNTPDINLQSYKGKVVFVNFWATWCPPCRAELPMIQKMVDEFKNKVVFIFVTNENWQTVSTFFNKNGYNFPVYNSVSNPPQVFIESNSIPQSFLINKQGKIVIKKIGAADWGSAKTKELIQKILNSN